MLGSLYMSPSATTTLCDSIIAIQQREKLRFWFSNLPKGTPLKGKGRNERQLCLTPEAPKMPLNIQTS